MDEDKVVTLRPREHVPGYSSLLDLEQQPDVSAIARSTGWWELDQIFKTYPGQFVVVTGLAGSGKSTFVLNIVLNMARELGTRSFLYVPENETHLRSKVRPMWPGNDASFRHFSEFQCFVQSAMPNTYEEEPRDLRWILDRAESSIATDQVELVVIDPWNELEHAKPKDVLMTDYIRMCLMYLKQFCRAYAVTVILVAHPTKAVVEGHGRVPMLSDIEGSMSWYNKCDNGLIVVREKDDHGARIISAKVREIGAGKLGVCHFRVNPDTGLFTPDYGGVYEKN